MLLNLFASLSTLKICSNLFRRASTLPWRELLVTVSYSVINFNLCNLIGFNRYNCRPFSFSFYVFEFSLFSILIWSTFLSKIVLDHHRRRFFRQISHVICISNVSVVVPSVFIVSGKSSFQQFQWILQRFPVKCSLLQLCSPIPARPKVNRIARDIYDTRWKIWDLFEANINIDTRIVARSPVGPEH